MAPTITFRRVAGVAALLVVVIAGTLPAWGESGANDERVMLQGFYWESCRHGHPERFPAYGDSTWYELVKDQAGAIQHAHFDLIWLPPPSYAGEVSAGYGPKEYFNLANSYGDVAQHRRLLKTLLRHGVEPVADLVLNHRDGSAKWADFRNPDWDTTAITKGDEAFTNRDSEAFGAAEDRRGADEESCAAYAPARGTTYAYPTFRDLDHTNPQVHRDIARYLLQLKSFGYRGWRYDMVHGYHARWIAYYNRISQPTFSVGEYDWGAQAEQRGWVWWTATDAAAQGDQRLATASSVFDFSTFFTLKANQGAGHYAAWYGFGNGIGLVGDTTDGIAWKARAVTFLENHDTGYRTNDDGTPQSDHQSDSFANSWEVEQGYAQILTHPGLPCVYWKHYFEWGDALRAKIDALINARKVAGIRAGSALHLQDNAKAKGVYAALVDGSHGALYVRIGGNDGDWQPGDSGYRDFREYAQGAGWKVWVGLPGNPPLARAPENPALPVPAYIPADQIPAPAEP